MPSNPSQTVTYDRRSLIVGGKRELLISGEIHYARVPPSEWGDVLRRSREAGLNCTATYMFWNRHEPREGEWRWTDEADIRRYLALCQENGLYVILRPGPYVCAEWNYGGFPAWLRDREGVRFRTFNQPYMERVEKYYRAVVAQVKPFLAGNGGPIILFQAENEYGNVAKRYGDEGLKYMDWLVQLVADLGVDVPAITCLGGAQGAIECVNGFSVVDEYEHVKARRPGQPGIWTENWPGWYDTWGYEHHRRDGREIAYEALRFLAAGGSGINYYMWHGGTNFERGAMYLQATSYDFDAPLNEWGLPTRKSALLRRLHEVLNANRQFLLDPTTDDHLSAHQDRLVARVCTLGDESLMIAVNLAQEPQDGTPAGYSGRIAPRSAIVALRHSQSPLHWDLLFSTDSEHSALGDNLQRAPWTPASQSEAPAWTALPEPLPSRRAKDTAARALSAVIPEEQVSLTRDESDYCWYAATYYSETGGGETDLKINRGGDLLYVYLNGALVGQTATPLAENAGSIRAGVETPPDQAATNRFIQTFRIPVAKGENHIEILACSLGLIKGDWMIGAGMEEERKGIWDQVTVGGNIVEPWRITPMLAGEVKGLPSGESTIIWPDIVPAGRSRVTWFVADAPLDQSARNDRALLWAFDADGLNKGMLWINGHCAGRYWTLPASGYGSDRAWHPATITADGEGEPTQRYYRIPRAWLRESNRIVVLSETGEAPTNAKLVCLAASE